MMLAFVGKCPDGMEVCHNDGDPGNPSLNNLRYDTKSANQQDRIRHGSHQFGELNPSSKFTAAQVEEVVRRVKNGEVQRRVAKEMGMSPPLVCNIVKGNRWGHLRKDHALSR